MTVLYRKGYLCKEVKGGSIKHLILLKNQKGV